MMRVRYWAENVKEETVLFEDLFRRLSFGIEMTTTPQNMVQIAPKHAAVVML